jgi:uncharacterized protein YxeA
MKKILFFVLFTLLFLISGVLIYLIFDTLTNLIYSSENALVKLFWNYFHFQWVSCDFKKI